MSDKISLSVEVLDLDKAVSQLQNFKQEFNSLRTSFEDAPNMTGALNEGLERAVAIVDMLQEKITRARAYNKTDDQNFTQDVQSGLEELGAMSTLFGQEGAFGASLAKSMMSGFSQSIRQQLNAETSELSSMLKSQTSRLAGLTADVAAREFIKSKPFEEFFTSKNHGDITSSDAYRKYVKELIPHVLPTFNTAEYQRARYGHILRNNASSAQPADLLPASFRESYRNKSYVPMAMPTGKRILSAYNRTRLRDLIRDDDEAARAAQAVEGLTKLEDNGELSLVREISPKMLDDFRRNLFTSFVKRASGRESQRVDVFKGLEDMTSKEARQLVSRMTSSSAGRLLGIMSDIDSIGSESDWSDAGSLGKGFEKLGRSTKHMLEQYEIAKYTVGDLFGKTGKSSRVMLSESQNTRMLGLEGSHNDFTDKVIFVSAEGYDRSDPKQQAFVEEMLSGRPVAIGPAGKKYIAQNMHGTGTHAGVRMIEQQAYEAVQKREQEWAREHGFVTDDGKGTNFWNDFVDFGHEFKDIEGLRKHFDATGKGWSNSWDTHGNFQNKNFAVVDFSKINDKNVKQKLADGIGWFMDGILPEKDFQGRMGVAGKGTFHQISGYKTVGEWAKALGLTDANGRFVLPGIGGDIDLTETDYHGFVDLSTLKNIDAYSNFKTPGDVNKAFSAVLQRYGMSSMSTYDDAETRAKGIGTQAMAFMKLSPKMRQQQIAEFNRRINLLSSEAGIKEYLFGDPNNYLGKQIREGRINVGSSVVQSWVQNEIESLTNRMSSGEWIDFGTNPSVINQTLNKAPIATLIQNGVGANTEEVLNRIKQKYNLTDDEVAGIFALNKGQIVDFARPDAKRVAIQRSPSLFGNFVIGKNYANLAKKVYEDFGLSTSGVFASEEDLKTLGGADLDGDKTKTAYDDLAEAFAETIAIQEKATKDFTGSTDPIVEKVKLSAGASKNVDSALHRRLYFEASQDVVNQMGAADAAARRAAMFDIYAPENKDLLAAAIQSNYMYEEATAQLKHATQTQATPQMKTALYAGAQWSKLPSHFSRLFNTTGRDNVDIPSQEDIFVANVNGREIPINMKELRALDFDKINFRSIFNTTDVGTMRAVSQVASKGVNMDRTYALLQALEHMGYGEAGETTQALMKNLRTMKAYDIANPMAPMSDKQLDDMQMMIRAAKREIEEEAYQKAQGDMIKMDDGSEVSYDAYVQKKMNEYGLTAAQGFIERGINQPNIRSVFRTDKPETLMPELFLGQNSDLSFDFAGKDATLQREAVEQKLQENKAELQRIEAEAKKHKEELNQIKSTLPKEDQARYEPDMPKEEAVEASRRIFGSGGDVSKANAEAAEVARVYDEVNRIAADSGIDTQAYYQAAEERQRILDENAKLGNAYKYIQAQEHANVLMSSVDAVKQQFLSGLLKKENELEGKSQAETYYNGRAANIGFVYKQLKSFIDNTEEFDQLPGKMKQGLKELVGGRSDLMQQMNQDFADTTELKAKRLYENLGKTNRRRANKISALDVRFEEYDKELQTVVDYRNELEKHLLNPKEYPFAPAERKKYEERLTAANNYITGATEETNKMKEADLTSMLDKIQGTVIKDPFQQLKQGASEAKEMVSQLVDRLEKVYKAQGLNDEEIAKKTKGYKSLNEQIDENTAFQKDNIDLQRRSHVRQILGTYSADIDGYDLEKQRAFLSFREEQARILRKQNEGKFLTEDERKLLGAKQSDFKRGYDDLHLDTSRFLTGEEAVRSRAQANLDSANKIIERIGKSDLRKEEKKRREDIIRRMFGDGYVDDQVSAYRTQQRIKDQQHLMQAERAEMQGQQMQRNWNMRGFSDPFSRHYMQRMNMYDQYRSQYSYNKLMVAQAAQVQRERKQALDRLSPNATDEERANAQTSYDTATAALNHWNAALEASKQGMQHFGDESGNFNSAMNAMGAAIDTAAEALDRLIQQFGRQIFQKAISEAKTFTTQFDTQMRQIQAITMKSDSEMATVRRQTIDRAIQLKTPVANVASVEADLYRQGLNDQQVEERTSAIIKFATVAGAKVTDAGKAITTAIQNGLVSSATEAMDVLVALGDTAATTAEQIFKGMQKSAAAAKVAGVSYEELTTLLTIGTSKTQLSGQVIGTGLQTIFSRMNRVTNQGLVNDQSGATTTINDVEAALKSAGVKLRNDDGKSFRNSFDVLRDLSKVWGSLTDIQRSNITYTMAGGRQMNVFQSLMEGMSEDGGAELERLLGMAENSEGTTENKYAISIKSVTAALDELKSTYDDLVNTIAGGNSIAPAIEGITGIINGFNNLISNGQGWVAGIAIIGAALVAFGVKAMIANAAVEGFGKGVFGVFGTILSLGAAAGIIAMAGGIGDMVEGASNNTEEARTKKQIESGNKFYEAQVKRTADEQKQIDKVRELGEAYERAEGQMKTEKAEALKSALEGLYTTLGGLSVGFDENGAVVLQWAEAVGEAQKKVTQLRLDAAKVADTAKFKEFSSNLETTFGENNRIVRLYKENGFNSRDIVQHSLAFAEQNPDLFYTLTDSGAVKQFVEGKTSQVFNEGAYTYLESIGITEDQEKYLKENENGDTILDEDALMNYFAGQYLLNLGNDVIDPNNPINIRKRIEDAKGGIVVPNSAAYLSDVLDWIEGFDGSSEFVEMMNNVNSGKVEMTPELFYGTLQAYQSRSQASLLSGAQVNASEAKTSAVESYLRNSSRLSYLFKDMDQKVFEGFISQAIKDINPGQYTDAGELANATEAYIGKAVSRYANKDAEFLNKTFNPYDSKYSHIITYTGEDGNQYSFGVEGDVAEDDVEQLARQHYKEMNETNIDPVVSGLGDVTQAVTTAGANIVSAIEKDEKKDENENPSQKESEGSGGDQSASTAQQEVAVEVKVSTDNSANTSVMTSTTTSSSNNNAFNADFVKLGDNTASDVGKGLPKPKQDTTMQNTREDLQQRLLDLGNRAREAGITNEELQSMGFGESLLSGEWDLNTLEAQVINPIEAEIVKRTPKNNAQPAKQTKHKTEIPEWVKTEEDLQTWLGSLSPDEITDMTLHGLFSAKRQKENDEKFMSGEIKSAEGANLVPLDVTQVIEGTERARNKEANIKRLKEMGIENLDQFEKYIFTHSNGTSADIISLLLNDLFPTIGWTKDQLIDAGYIESRDVENLKADKLKNAAYILLGDLFAEEEHDKVYGKTSSGQSTYRHLAVARNPYDYTTDVDSEGVAHVRAFVSPEDRTRTNPVKVALNRGTTLAAYNGLRYGLFKGSSITKAVETAQEAADKVEEKTEEIIAEVIGTESPVNLSTLDMPQLNEIVNRMSNIVPQVMPILSDQFESVIDGMVDNALSFIDSLSVEPANAETTETETRKLDNNDPLMKRRKQNARPTSEDLKAEATSPESILNNVTPFADASKSSNPNGQVRRTLDQIVDDTIRNAKQTDLTSIYSGLLSKATNISTIDELTEMLGTDAENYASLFNSNEKLRKIANSLIKGDGEYSIEDFREELRQGAAGTTLKTLMPQITGTAYTYDQQLAALTAVENGTATTEQMDLVAKQWGIDRNTLMNNKGAYTVLERNRLQGEAGAMGRSAATVFNKLFDFENNAEAKALLADANVFTARAANAQAINEDRYRFDRYFASYAGNNAEYKSMMEAYKQAGYTFEMDDQGHVTAKYKGKAVEEDQLNPFDWNRRHVSKAQTLADVNTIISGGELTGKNLEERKTLVKSYSSELSQYLELSEDLKNSTEGKQLLEKVKIQVAVDGLDQLAELGRMSQEAVTAVRQLTAGGTLRFDALRGIRASTYSDTQLAGLVNASDSSFTSEMDQALMGALNLTEAQYRTQDRSHWQAELGRYLGSSEYTDRILNDFREEYGAAQGRDKAAIARYYRDTYGVRWDNDENAWTIDQDWYKGREYQRTNPLKATQPIHTSSQIRGAAQGIFTGRLDADQAEITYGEYLDEIKSSYPELYEYMNTGNAARKAELETQIKLKFAVDGLADVKEFKTELESIKALAAELSASGTGEQRINALNTGFEDLQYRAYAYQQLDKLRKGEIGYQDVGDEVWKYAAGVVGAKNVETYEDAQRWTDINGQSIVDLMFGNSAGYRKEREAALAALFENGQITAAGIKALGGTVNWDQLDSDGNIELTAGKKPKATVTLGENWYEGVSYTPKRKYTTAGVYSRAENMDMLRTIREQGMDLDAAQKEYKDQISQSSSLIKALQLETKRKNGDAIDEKELAELWTQAEKDFSSSPLAGQKAQLTTGELMDQLTNIAAAGKAGRAVFEGLDSTVQQQLMNLNGFSQFMLTLGENTEAATQAQKTLARTVLSETVKALEEEGKVIKGLSSNLDTMLYGDALSRIQQTNDLMANLQNFTEIQAAYDRVTKARREGKEIDEGDWNLLKTQFHWSEQTSADYLVNNGNLERDYNGVVNGTTEEGKETALEAGKQYILTKVGNEYKTSEEEVRPGVVSVKYLSDDEAAAAYIKDHKNELSSDPTLKMLGLTFDENGELIYSPQAVDNSLASRLGRRRIVDNATIGGNVGKSNDYGTALSIAQWKGMDFDLFERLMNGFEQAGEFGTKAIQDWMLGDEYAELYKTGNFEGVISRLFSLQNGYEASNRYNINSEEVQKYLRAAETGNYTVLDEFATEDPALKNFIQTISGWNSIYSQYMTNQTVDEAEKRTLKGERVYAELAEMERLGTVRKGTAETGRTLVTGTAEEQRQAVNTVGAEIRKVTGARKIVDEMLTNTDEIIDAQWVALEATGEVGATEIEYYKQHTDEISSLQERLQTKENDLSDSLETAIAKAFNIGSFNSLADEGNKQIRTAVENMLNLAGLQIEQGEDGFLRIQKTGENRSGSTIAGAAANTVSGYGDKKTLAARRKQFYELVFGSEDAEGFKTGLDVLAENNEWAKDEENWKKVLTEDQATLMSSMLNGGISYESFQNQIQQGSPYAPLYLNDSLFPVVDTLQQYAGTDFMYNPDFDREGFQTFVSSTTEGSAFASMMNNLDYGADVMRTFGESTDEANEYWRLFLNALKAKSIDQMKQWGDDTKDVADSVQQLGKNSKTALSTTGQLISKMAKLNDQAYAASKARGKSGSQLDQTTLGVLSSAAGIDKQAMKKMTKGEIESIADMVESSADEEFLPVGQIIAERFRDSVNKAIGDGKITLDQVLELSVDGQGTFDFAGIEELAKMMSDEELAALAAYAGKIATLTAKYSSSGEQITVENVLTSLLGGGGSGYKSAGGGGGGGGGKSAAQKLMEELKREQSLRNHEIKMIQFQETRYHNKDEYGNENAMIALENEAQKRLIKTLQDAIEKTKQQMAQTKKGSDDWNSLYDSVLNYEEAIEQATQAIEDNTKKMLENEKAILKTRTDLEQSVLKEIEARKQRERDMLDGTVSMQDIVLEAIRQRYRDEWELVKKDIEKKKEALEEEKSLIDERLQRRKDAEDEAEKYEELAEYKKQLALIQTDSTRTKDAAKLREKIAEIEKEIAWDAAQDEADYQKEQIDDQLEAYDDFLNYGEEDLESFLEDANNLSAEVTSVMQLNQDGLMQWLRENVKEYALAMTAAQQQMIQGWTDTYEQMLGITHTYWEEINEILTGKQTWLEYMKQSQEYIDASEDERKTMLIEWGEMYDKYVAAHLTGATYSHTDEQLAGTGTSGSGGGSGGGGGGSSDGAYRVQYKGYTWSSKYASYDAAEAAIQEAMKKTGASRSDYRIISPEPVGTYVGEAAQETEPKMEPGAIVETSKPLTGLQIYNPDQEQAMLDAILDQEKLEQFKRTNKYASGGLVDYTGPAWVDGTPSKPEAFLSAEDTQMMRNWIESAKYVQYRSTVSNIDGSAFNGSSQNIGELIINITEAQFKDDADFDEVARRVGNQFVKELSKQGFHTMSYSF